MEKRKSNIYGGAAAHSAQSTHSHMQYTKYSNLQRHGFSAEDANALHDALRGRYVQKVGVSNALNGADRIANGVEIQTKYCRTAACSVDAAFTDNVYRYPGQRLEVPKDQYDEAVRRFADHIRAGHVPGVANPDAARDMVRRGSVSYDGARRIAKAGTIDSIKFDAMSQAVTCACAGGLSFVVSYVRARNRGKTHSEALAAAAQSACVVGGTTLAVGVATQQLLRTSLGRALSASATSTASRIVETACSTQAGQKVVERAASAMVGSQVSGQAAKQTLAKSLRTNMVTGGVMFGALTAVDLVKLCDGDISGADFAENAVANAAGIGAGSAGATLGTALGSAIFPGIGTLIGSFIGAIAAGAGASAAVHGVGSLLRD